MPPRWPTIHSYSNLSPIIPLYPIYFRNTLQLCDFNDRGEVIVSPGGIELQRKMKIETKPMKKIKMTGDDASKLIDQMFSELD